MFVLSVWKEANIKIYIAGPMTGYEKWNFPAFFEAEEMLKSMGHNPVNPAHNDGDTIEKALESAGSPERPNNTWGYYMRRDLPHVMECEALCVLDGWQKSKGASLEVHVAKALGMPILYLKDGQLIPRVSVVGLSGWARAGKDTVADYLVTNYGYRKMSFADPMKEALVKLNPMIHVGNNLVYLGSVIDKIGWEDLKGLSPEIRPLLQRFGTEVGREMFGENFWVDYALDSVPNGSKIVFADVRFPNEADAIKNLGGNVVRIEREGFGPANDHISEHALDEYKFDEKIYNNEGIEELHNKVSTFSW